MCVIGNSHAAALRAGLDISTDLSEKFTFDFFAAQSDLMREMELRGTALVPTSNLTRLRISQVSGGNVEIETTRYADFIVVGMGFNIVKVMNALDKFRLFGFNYNGSEDVPYLSHACLLALIRSILGGSTAIHLARLLRSTSNARIVMIPQSYPSEEILKGEQASTWNQAVSNGFLEYVAQRYEEIAKQVVADAGCDYLPQASNTLLPGPFTQAKFSINSVRLGADKNRKHPAGEPFHMNDLFGASVLKNYDEWLTRQESIDSNKVHQVEKS